MTYRRDLIWPLALIVLGVILLLRSLGYIPASWDQWWPLILIVIGLWILFAGSASHAGGRRHLPTGGFILIGLGLALLAGNLLGGRGTGALILIALGLAILAGRIWSRLPGTDQGRSC